MLVYEKKVQEEDKLVRHLFGTMGNVPSEDDERLVYREKDGDIMEPVEKDIYLDDKHHGIIRKSDGKNVCVFINDAIIGEYNIIPGEPFTPTPTDVESIEITTAPTKVAYTEGQKLDLTGMVVKATYADGDVKVVTGYTTTPSTSTRLERNMTSVVVTFGGKTASFAITVAEHVLTDLEWTIPPVKVSYKEGEVFDLAGSIVDGTYKTAEGEFIEKVNVSDSVIYTLMDSGNQVTREVPATVAVTLQDNRCVASLSGIEAEQAITVTAEVKTPEELAEAIAKGGNVKVMADMETNLNIAEGKEVVLDLGGHNISYSDTAIVNNGSLTITNTANGGKISSTGRNAIQINAGSTTVIDSGDFEAREFVVASVNATGAQVTINGGTFTSSDNCVLGDNGTAREGEGNSFVINDGTFNGNIASAGYIACGIYAPWKDTITVNGGTFNINNGVGICSRAGQTTVNGGTFNCSGTGTGKVGDSANQVPAGTGMYFDEEAHYPAHLDTDFVKAKGGIFSSRPDAKYIAEGYEAVEIEGGKFEIRPVASKKKFKR